ncbi:unnamed protein product [Meloidogyne enterolobii]|uniref:Uncharacterized protein n=1 Tax=Meloidogyne enterolobii TaxID=390850 RepID=A0ACB0ZWT7_MELEN
MPSTEIGNKFFLKVFLEKILKICFYFKEITNKSTNINSSNAGGIQSEKIEGKQIVMDKKTNTEPTSIYPYPYGSWPY